MSFYIGRFVHTLPALMNLTMVAEDLSREEEELYTFAFTGSLFISGLARASNHEKLKHRHYFLELLDFFQTRSFLFF
jgi:hypothetical protein